MKRRKDPKGRVLKDGESYRKTDNSYMYRWTAANKVRHTIYAKTLEQLREKEEDVRQDILDGIQMDKKNSTVNTCYLFWKESKTFLKEHTLRNYIYIYEHFIEKDLGERKIKEITESEVKCFYHRLLDKKGITVSTLDNIHTVLHQIFKVAVQNRIIRFNTVSGLMREIKQSCEKPKQKHSLTVAQQNAFLNYMANTPKYRHWLPLFTFFLGTGCRVGEVVALRWCDVNLEENYIDINHALSYYPREGGKCMYDITTVKTEAGNRKIPLLPEVKQALFQEKEHQEECELTCNANIDGYTDFVFLNRFGLNHNPQAVNRAIARIINEYNREEEDLAAKENRPALLLPKFSCHNLRHTFATRLCENGMNMKVAQKIMGHENVSITMDIYVEATNEATVWEFEKLKGTYKLRGN